MNFNMNMRKILLTSAIAFSAASAFAADNQAEVVTQQKSLLEKLDSLSAAVLGLKINGTAKAGALASFSSSDQYTAESPTQENQAFTDVNLRLTARPSSETMIDVQLRLHKDWQSAYDENNNPVIGHWFSYDGTILNKHVDFNLGYMRVGYTPFTIYTPQTEILQEPEIFVEKRLKSETSIRPAVAFCRVSTSLTRAVAWVRSITLPPSLRVLVSAIRLKSKTRCSLTSTFLTATSSVGVSVPMPMGRTLV